MDIQTKQDIYDRLYTDPIVDRSFNTYTPKYYDLMDFKHYCYLQLWDSDINNEFFDENNNFKGSYNDIKHYLCRIIKNQTYKTSPYYKKNFSTIELKSNEYFNVGENEIHIKENNTETDNIIRLIQDISKTLKPYDQFIFKMFFEDNLSVKEISTSCDINKQSIYLSLRRSKERIKIKLKKYGIKYYNDIS